MWESSSLLKRSTLAVHPHRTSMPRLIIPLQKLQTHFGKSVKVSSIKPTIFTLYLSTSNAISSAAFSGDRNRAFRPCIALEAQNEQPIEHILAHWEQMSSWERKRIEIFNRSPFRSFYDAVPIAVTDPIDVAQGFLILERVSKFEVSVFAFVPDNNINKVVFAQKLL